MADRTSRRRPVTRDVFDQYKRRLSGKDVEHRISTDGIRPDTGVWVRDTTHDIDHPIRRSASPSRTPQLSVPEIYVRNGTPETNKYSKYTPESSPGTNEHSKYKPESNPETNEHSKYKPESNPEINEHSKNTPDKRKNDEEKLSPGVTRDHTFKVENRQEKTIDDKASSSGSDKSKLRENDDHWPTEHTATFKPDHNTKYEKHKPEEDIIVTEQKPSEDVYTPADVKYRTMDNKYKLEQTKHKPIDNTKKTRTEAEKQEDGHSSGHSKDKLKDRGPTPDHEEDTVKQRDEEKQRGSGADHQNKEKSETAKDFQDDSKSFTQSKSKRPLTSQHKLDSSTFGPYSYMKSTSHNRDNGTDEDVLSSSSGPPSEDRETPSPVFKNKAPPGRPISSSRPASHPIRGLSPPRAQSAVLKEQIKRTNESDTESAVGELPPKRTPLSRRDFRAREKELGVRKGSTPRWDSASKESDENKYIRISSSRDHRTAAPKRVTSRVEKATNRLNRSRLTKSRTLSISYNHSDIVDDDLLISASKLDNTLLRLFSNTRDTRTSKKMGSDDEDGLIPYLNYSESDLISMEPVRWRVFPMEAAHKETLEQELPYIENNVQPYGVIKTLYDDDVLTHMDFTQFSRTEGQGDRAVTRLLVKTLQRRGNKAYPAFVGALKTHDYQHVSDRLEETERAIRQGMMDDAVGRSMTTSSFNFKPTPPPPRKTTPIILLHSPPPSVPGDGENSTLAYYRQLAAQPTPPPREKSEMLVIDSKDLEKHLRELSRELQEIQSDVNSLRKPQETSDKTAPTEQPTPEVQFTQDQPQVRPQKSRACAII